MFNPYQAFMPFRAASGLGILRGINWATLLSNTQKTLNIVNQAIPIVYQVKPFMNNARTILRVVNELGKSTRSTTPSNNNTISNVNNNQTLSSDYDSNQPVFFI